MVQKTMATAGAGGGFTLKTTGSHANLDPDLPREMLLNVIKNVEAYIDAGLEFGRKGG